MSATTALTMDEAPRYFADRRVAGSAGRELSRDVLWRRVILSSAAALLALIGFGATAGLAVGVKTAVIGAGLSVLLYPLMRGRKTAAPSDLSLYLGEATGQLAERNHKAAASGGQQILLKEADACMNVVVQGGIGSGKSTEIMYSLLVQLLDQDCGGLVKDVKTNFKDAVAAAAAAVGEKGKRVVVVGPGHSQMNLLAGLSPEQAASNLKSALLLVGNVNESPIWVNTAADWCQSALGVLSHLPDRYDLGSLYRYLYNPEYQADVVAEVQVVAETLDEARKRVLQSYLDYRDIVFDNFSAEFVAGVRATVAQVLSPFTHPELIDAFCREPAEEQSKFRMDDILEGSVFLVDLPLSRWGLGAKTAYTFLKLRFFSVVQSRFRRPNGLERPVFYLCDEFQEIVSANKDGLSDLNFWDKSREARCMGIISWQGLVSAYAAIGNRDVADAILQNFRQKVFFGTEDPHTLQSITSLLGTIDVERRSESRSHSSGDGRSSSGVTTNVSTERRDAVDAQLVRNLAPSEALMLLRLGRRATDDVVRLRPIYLPRKPTQTTSPSG